jgi:hypothetical protein
MDDVLTGLLEAAEVQIVLNFLRGLRQTARAKDYLPTELAISLDNFTPFGFSEADAAALAEAGLIERTGKRLSLSELGASIWETYMRRIVARPRPIVPELLIPIWWPKTRELCLGDIVVRHFKKNSPKVQAVLKAYLDSGCAPKVKNPFSGKARVRSLRKAIECVNVDQDFPKAMFRADKGSWTFTCEVVRR